VLHVPAAYSGGEPVPLIVDLHAGGDTGGDELASSPYPAVTDPEGVVMAFPEGLPGPIGSSWNMGPCCVADVDDLAFVRALVTDIESVACIDPDRVYAVGVLAGGGMAYHLACQAADVFAAVAPAAADLLQETVDDCRPSRPITVISFRGTDSTRVPYEGGASALIPEMPITFLGAEATLERWAQIDGCMGSPSPPNSNGCSSYTTCSGGVEVILCTRQGGQEEPGDAALAWPVLKRHAL
jgi:polyhydroxybutyrate depolymerase